MNVWGCPKSIEERAEAAAAELWMKSFSRLQCDMSFPELITSSYFHTTQVREVRAESEGLKRKQIVL